jgi:hypothetical protein
MRLAKANPELGAQDRADRLRRIRSAAQVVRIAFPAVQHIHLGLKFESANRLTPASQSHQLHPPARAFFEFPCPYADCGGSFDLTSAVNAAVADLARHSEGVLNCEGLRPLSYASRQLCGLRLIYTVDATFYPAK